MNVEANKYDRIAVLLDPRIATENLLVGLPEISFRDRS